MFSARKMMPTTTSAIVVRIRYPIKYSEAERYFSTRIRIRRFKNIMTPMKMESPITPTYSYENILHQKIRLCHNPNTRYVIHCMKVTIPPLIFLSEITFIRYPLIPIEMDATIAYISQSSIFYRLKITASSSGSLSIP
jgi:hypothetical protein